jgi:hypothetical protein
MNETEQYILDAIKTRVWSGFASHADVQQLVDDLLTDEGSDDVDEAALRAAVPREFALKRDAEKAWPRETDCDRLDAAFTALNGQGVVALHDAGYTMSDGFDDVSQVLHERGRDKFRGYCFYHGQDLERALAGHGLMLAFGDLDDTASGKLAIGKLVASTLEAHGLVVSWNGSAETRIDLPKFDWKRRART